MIESRYNLRNIFVAVIAIFITVPLTAQSVSHGISAAQINVVQNDSENTTNSVTVTTSISINQFSIRAGSNRGDYNVQVGLGFSDDVDNGVMLSCVTENGRDNGDTNSPGVNYCTSAIEYSRTGGNAGAFYIPTFSAPSAAEYNITVAAAYFPYTNWIAGYARNSGDTNGGFNDLFTGSPGLVLGTHFVDQGGGVSTVNLTSLGIDSRTNGVLLVTHGRNEDNYSLSQVNGDGTWNIYVKDNGSDADAYEQDPVAFVFIPKTNTTVVSGRFRGDGALLMFSGTTPQFSVTNSSVGNWRLTIPGYSSGSGVLVISAEGGFGYNRDNIVSYEPDGDGWIIQTRDLPGKGLQTPGTEPVVSFVFVPVGITTALVSPVENAPNQPLSVNLKINVSNAVPGNLKVEFYGRKAIDDSGEFTIALLPDTQYYTAERNGGTKEMFIAQTEWIITNRVAQNIAYVVHLGDISDSGDIKSGSANTTEWRNSTNAMYRLENPTRTSIPTGIPYGVAVGNHDSEPIGDANGTTTFYNQYFGVQHFAGKPYYAGHYGTNNDNHFDFFSAGGMDFIVLYYEFDTNTTPAALAWGNTVLQTNAHRRAIIVTHNFGNTSTPLNFSPQGSRIYNALKANTNIFMMLAGHVTGEGSRADTFNGNTIRTYIQDYQGWTNGGNGFMRTMTFSPANNQVVVQTFSPWTGEYETDANSDFFFPYNMTQPSGTNASPFNLLGVVSNVPPGNIASLAWPGLEKYTAYEWQVVVTDMSSNAVTGPTWEFSTAPDYAPVASNQLITVMGDAPTNLILTAFDGNGDVLTFFTNTLPMNGVNLNFNTNGTVTYLPTRGFRGQDRFVYHATDGFASTATVTLNMNIVSPPDTNANGLPDFWENTFGITDPTADNDGDGQINSVEYISNTNPTNSTSVLETTATRATNGYITLAWPTMSGVRYRVQFSNGGTNGSFTGAFTDIVRPLSSEMNSSLSEEPITQIFVDDFTVTGSPSTNQARYYRIKTVP